MYFFKYLSSDVLPHSNNNKDVLPQSFHSKPPVTVPHSGLLESYRTASSFRFVYAMGIVVSLLPILFVKIVKVQAARSQLA